MLYPVNRNQTVNIMTRQPETIEIPSHADEVACDGGDGALGHPLVYYTFDGKTQLRCGYCDRLFVKAAHNAI